MAEPPDTRSGAPFDDSVFGACLLTLADFSHAIAHEPRTRRFVQIGLGIGLCLGGGGVVLLARHRTLQGGALLALGLFAMLAYNAPEHIAGRWYAKTPPKARALKYTLNPQGLVVVSELSLEFHPWVKLYGLSEAPETFMVWLDEKVFIVLPKRAFAAGDVERARALLRSRLGEKQRSPRPLVPLWLVALLGVAALLVWNWLWPR
jgi:YcxB-like protein